MSDEASKDKDSKDELDRLIKDGKAKGQQIVNLGGNILRWGQETVDLSDASSRVVQHPAPPEFNRETAINSWKNLNHQQDILINRLKPINIPLYATSSSTVAYSMIPYTNAESILTNIDKGKHEKVRADTEQLSHVLGNFANKESVSALLKQFGLEKAANLKKSPFELFEIAWAAFEKPVTDRVPAITSLVPIRECIRETVETLLRLRPMQEPTKKEYGKIVSILTQLAYDGIPKEQIESWANQWSAKGGLLDELSGAKDRTLLRDEWHRSLRRATLFLREILQALDPGKLK